MRQSAVEELWSAIRAPNQGKVKPQTVALASALSHNARPMVHRIGPASLADDLAGSTASTIVDVATRSTGSSAGVVGEGNVMGRSAGIAESVAMIGRALAGGTIRRRQRRWVTAIVAR